jgi:nucleoside-diphosphate-sugar epimerase
VSLRPGAFLDQGRGDFWAAGLKRGRLPFIGDANVPLTFVHTSDVARMLVDAVSVEMDQSVVRIDLGCDRPATIVELAAIMGSLLGRHVSPQVPPWSLVSAALAVAGVFDPWKRDLRAMMGYIRRGGYVANTALQSRFFGPPPSLEAAVERYLLEIGLEGPKTPRSGPSKEFTGQRQ